MRITCYVPDGELTDELLAAVLSLVCVAVQLETAARWTRLERVLAYDWAIREHLHASDNAGIKRRDRPSFLDTAASAAT